MYAAGHLRGVVTLVQERRFQLVDDDAVAHLLVLAHDARLDESMLEELQRSGARVSVNTAPAHGLIAPAATEVSMLQT